MKNTRYRCNCFTMGTRLKGIVAAVFSFVNFLSDVGQNTYRFLATCRVDGINRLDIPAPSLRYS